MNSSQKKDKCEEANGVSLNNVTFTISQTNVTNNSKDSKKQPNLFESPHNHAKNNQIKSNGEKKLKQVSFKENGFVNIIPVENWKKYNMAQITNENGEVSASVKCACSVI